MRNTFIAIIITAIALFYFLLMPDGDSFKTLQKQVSPTVSLYPSAKSLQDPELIDDNQNTVLLSTVVQGKWSVLYFGYAACPDICPIDLSILNQAFLSMQHQDKLQVVFISVDPKRDVGKSSAFAKRFNPNFIGLSATDEALTSLTKKLGVYYEVAQTKQRSTQEHSAHQNMQTGEHYLINHTASYLLLSPELRLTGLLTNPHHAEKIASALDLIVTTLD